MRFSLQPVASPGLKSEAVSLADALLAHVDSLECRLRHHELVPAFALQRLRDCLETIPCSTAEYSRALNHLINASGYYRRREPGAARYELLLLLRQLRPLARDLARS